MREERKNQNPELNEAALSGVSGGGSGSKAATLCGQCTYKATCSHSCDLATYLFKHGENSVASPLRCPYFNEMSGKE